MNQAKKKTNCCITKHLKQLLRCAALFTAAAMMIFAVSCQINKSDDKTMTEDLINEYMSALCKYNIGDMNKTSLFTLDAYGDGDEVKTTCKLLASKIQWEQENISINGNSAIAQVKITLPSDFEGICADALNDAMLQIEQNLDKSPYNAINAAVKVYADKAETTEISAEIHMSKVDNKWFIVKSQNVGSIISDIRTPVAAIYSLTGE